MSDNKTEFLDGVDLQPGEEISEETVLELTGGKEDDDDE